MGPCCHGWWWWSLQQRAVKRMAGAKLTRHAPLPGCLERGLLRM